MKRKLLRIRIALLIVLVSIIATQWDFTLRKGSTVVTHETPAALPQFDDPYADFRNARYSNNGLLNEPDEIKLGTQLHREVTKRFRLTDVVNDARERVCGRTSSTNFTWLKVAKSMGFRSLAGMCT